MNELGPIILGLAFLLGIPACLAYFVAWLLSAPFFPIFCLCILLVLVVMFVLGMVLAAKDSE